MFLMNMLDPKTDKTTSYSVSGRPNIFNVSSWIEERVSITERAMIVSGVKDSNIFPGIFPTYPLSLCA